MQTPALKAPPTSQLLPQNVEVGWGYSVSGIACLSAVSSLVMMTSGFTKVYTNRQRNGHCGILHPAFPTEGVIPRRVRNSTFCWEYFWPTLLLSREDFLEKCGKKVILNFEKLEGVERSVALMDVFEDFVFYNKKIGL